MNQKENFQKKKEKESNIAKTKYSLSKPFPKANFKTITSCAAIGVHEVPSFT